MHAACEGRFYLVSVSPPCSHTFQPHLQGICAEQCEDRMCMAPNFIYWLVYRPWPCPWHTWLSDEHADIYAARLTASVRYAQPIIPSTYLDIFLCPARCLCLSLWQYTCITTQCIQRLALA